MDGCVCVRLLSIPAALLPTRSRWNTGRELGGSASFSRTSSPVSPLLLGRTVRSLSVCMGFWGFTGCPSLVMFHPCLPLQSTKVHSLLGKRFLIENTKLLLGRQPSPTYSNLLTPFSRCSRHACASLTHSSLLPSLFSLSAHTVRNQLYPSSTLLALMLLLQITTS